MNILLCHSHWYKTGGDWTYLSTIIDLYKKNGHSVYEFGLDLKQNEINNKYFVKGIDIASRDKSYKDQIQFYGQLLYRGIYNNQAKLQLEKMLDEVDIDVIQLNSIHNTLSLSIIEANKKKEIPIIWRMLDYKIVCPNRTMLSNGNVCRKCVDGSPVNALINKCKNNSYLKSSFIYIEQQFNIYKKYYDKVDAFMAQSNFSANLLLDFGIPQKKIHIVKNPISCEINIEIKIQSECKYFLYFGRISEEKGLEELIEAFAISDVELNLKIVGDGPYLNKIQNIVKDKFLLDKVQFFGQVWGDQLEKIIKSAEFVVVPSVWNEVSPYSILQSYRQDVPVLGSDIGGIPDIVIEGTTGMLFNPNSKEDFAKALNKMYLTVKDKIYTNKCINYLLSNHTEKMYYEKTIKIIRELK
jgi:glycosyltransferase involved in cell wall biosynthesis